MGSVEAMMVFAALFALAGVVVGYVVGFALVALWHSRRD
jgi:hypothetical protein